MYPVMQLTQIEGNTFDVEYRENPKDGWVWQARIVREGPVFFVRAGGLTVEQTKALHQSTVYTAGIYYL